MLAVSVSIIGFIPSDTYPDLVRCVFVDAWGREKVFIEKLPIVTAAGLDESTPYPQPGAIACELIRRWHDDTGREIVTVDIERPWGILDQAGQTRFDILPSQLTEC